jgi:hypothetical protein
MAVRFTPCPACARHVKEGDGACPFCGANVPRTATPAMPKGRLSRAALLAASAAGALAMADCGGSTSAEPLYGGVSQPVEAGGPGDDASALADGGGIGEPLYGAVAPPFPDAGESSGEDAGSGPTDASAPADAARAADAARPTDAASVADAGRAADAAAPDSGDVVDGGHMVQPLYGGFMPLYGGIAPPYGIAPREE